MKKKPIPKKIENMRHKAYLCMEKEIGSYETQIDMMFKNFEQWVNYRNKCFKYYNFAIGIEPLSSQDKPSGLFEDILQDAYAEEICNRYKKGKSFNLDKYLMCIDYKNKQVKTQKPKAD